MNQVVANISKKSYFKGTEEECRNYVTIYGLVPDRFKVLPFDPKCKVGDFGEMMQIQLGNYRPVLNQVDAILEEKTNYSFNQEIQNIVKKKIYDLIKNTNESVKRDKIIADLLKLGYDIPERKVRSLIEELINKDGLAIQSSETGYQLIQDSEQLMEAIKYLKNKAFPLFERANNLKKNFYNDKSIQLSFEDFFNDPIEKHNNVKSLKYKKNESR